MKNRPLDQQLEGWQRTRDNTPSQHRPALPPPPWVTILVVVMLLISLALWPNPQTDAFVTPYETTVPLPEATPEDCLQGERQRGRNATLMVAQQWERIIEETAVVLRQPDLCPNARLALHAEQLGAQLELLLSSPIPPYDWRHQQTQLQRYEALCAEAQALGVALPGERSIAQRAYSAEAFLLANAAFEAAWLNGTLRVHDQELIRQYASSLYNLGYWWTFSPGPAFESGLTFLATSYAVDQEFRIGSGAAEERLRALLGSDQTIWPAPQPSPLLTIGK